MERKSRIALWSSAIGVVVIVVVGLIWWTGRTPDSPQTNQSIDLASEWVRGNPTGKVEIIEYSDFQCPACLSFEPYVKDVVEKYGQDVRLVYRHFPLRKQHPNSDLAARASEAAGKRGKFWEMHDQLFDNQPTWSPQFNPKDTFVGYAREIGLDPDVFEDDLNAEDVRNAVNQDADRGKELGVNSTPTFYVNGELLQVRKYEDLENRVKELLEASAP